MNRIKNLKARPILNSEGNWSIECYLALDNNQEAIVSVPQGISTGEEEKASVEVKKAINQIEKQIKPALQQAGELTQSRLDALLSQNPEWGSNSTLAVSAAFAKASGFFKLNQKPKLPRLMMIVFEGEKHGNPNLTIQEFMVVVDQIEEGVAFYQKTKKHLEAQKVITTVGSEGGFSPADFTDEDILKTMKDLGAVKIALDVAGNINPPTPASLLDIVRRYPIFSLEDPFPENQTQQWQEFFISAIQENPKLLIIGDDLTVTDSEKIKSGAEQKLFNAVIIKPNQQGTISAAVAAAKTAKTLGIKTIASHRGQETNDHWAADLALKIKADFVKFGAPARGERVAKYNRLLKLVGPAGD